QAGPAPAGHDIADHQNRVGNRGDGEHRRNHGEGDHLWIERDGHDSPIHCEASGIHLAHLQHEEATMAKQKMRRQTTQDDGGGMSGAMVKQARTASLGIIDVATQTTQAALSGMEEIGRTLADMATPAVRRSAQTASSMSRAAVEGAGQVSRAASDAMSRTADDVGT